MRSPKPSRRKSAAAASNKPGATPRWNLTERTRSEEAFRQSQARLSAVLETAVDAIITIDERGRMQSINASTTRMFGYSAAEMIGRNVSMLMPQPYQQEHDEYLARYLRTGEKRIIGIGREVQGMRKDGTVFPVDLAVSEVEPGKLFTGIIRDISERKLAEARLRESDRMASIGALAAGLGHDMNNVLLPVRAHLNALKSTKEAPTNQLEHIERIQKGVSYLQQLADGLHFLAMNPDEVEEVEGATDLQLWWDQTGPLLSKAVPKHVKVVVSLPTALPRIAVAAHSLTQAVLNLIVNAGEAIPGPPERKRRQGYVRLWAELVPSGVSIRLGVTDNGTGMNEDVKRRAFDMFFTTKPRGLGTGLGLALVRKVVARAGGMVEIESELGKGTTVVMNLPTTQDAAAVHTTAVIRIRNGRAASLAKNLLEAAGVAVATESEMGTSDIWVVEMSQITPAALHSWRKNRPNGQLVFVGQMPNRGEFQDLSDFISIDNPDDYEQVRTALGLAMHKMKETV